MVVDCQIQSNLSFFGTLGVLLILMRTENTFSKQTLSCKIKVSLDVPSREHRSVPQRELVFLTKDHGNTGVSLRRGGT